MISVATDLVLDVVRAADKSQVMQAHNRLSQIAHKGVSSVAFGADGSASGGRKGSFDFMRLDAHLADIHRQQSGASQNEGAGQISGLSSVARARVSTYKGSPEQQFEAFLLQKFVDAMLPSNAEGFFGKGNAGNIWKSMMAEQLGLQIAKSGVLGISDKLNI